MKVTLTSVAGPPGSPLGEWLARDVHRRSSFPALVRPFDWIVVDLTGAAAPTGPVSAEARAVLARRAGATLEWGEPRLLATSAQLFRLNRQRGIDSVAAMRENPSLLTELQVGAWTESGWRTRLLCRLVVGARLDRVLGIATAGAPSAVIGLAGDIAFWGGVRRAATRQEWRRLTRSYVVLSYHRISADWKPDQELLEVTPQAFHQQVRWLQRLRFRPLHDTVLEAAHHDAAAMPARGYVITADDGFLDCTEPLRQAEVHAQLFVPTANVAGVASPAWYTDHPSPGWRVDGEPLADWPRLRAIENDGVRVGGHGRRHVALTELSDHELTDELQASAADLRRELAAPARTMAYPHGLHDAAVRNAARAAEFSLAFTTQFGRNGAGTDPWCLRRVPVFREDVLPTFLWKVLTGEPASPRLSNALAKLAFVTTIIRRPSRDAIENTIRGRRLLARVVGTSEKRATRVVSTLEAAGLQPCVAGGWGIDALVGRTTRRHLDLDVIVAASVSHAQVAAALRGLGYRSVRRVNTAGVAFTTRWQFRDLARRSLDVIPVGGTGEFRDGSRVLGRIGGLAVWCLSPEAQKAARMGYPLRAVDERDALQLRTLEAPAE